jgi:enolase
VLQYLQLITSIIRGHAELSELMIGIVLHNHQLLKSSEPGHFQYELEDHASKSSMEMVDSLLALWQEQEIIAVDMPLAVGDLSGLRYLRKVSDCRRN